MEEQPTIDRPQIQETPAVPLIRIDLLETWRGIPI
jgi:hypothetical protein